MKKITWTVNGVQWTGKTNDFSFETKAPGLASAPHKLQLVYIMNIAKYSHRPTPSWYVTVKVAFYTQNTKLYIVRILKSILFGVRFHQVKMQKYKLFRNINMLCVQLLLISMLKSRMESQSIFSIFPSVPLFMHV